MGRVRFDTVGTCMDGRDRAVGPDRQPRAKALNEVPVAAPHQPVLAFLGRDEVRGVNRARVGATQPWPHQRAGIVIGRRSRGKNRAGALARGPAAGAAARRCHALAIAARRIELHGTDADRPAAPAPTTATSTCVMPYPAVDGHSSWCRNPAGTPVVAKKRLAGRGEQA